MKHNMIAFGWLNFSAADMKRTKEAIAELKVPGSVDELGISIIRDGFADRLFPGLNVMQTSLKYYLLLPAMLQEIERKFPKIGENENIRPRLLEKLIEKECRFCDAAVKAARQPEGIIGQESAGQKIYAKRMSRFPHSIYWHGMDIFGLLPDHYSTLRDFCEGMRARQRDSDDESRRDRKLPWGEKFAIYRTVTLEPEAPAGKKIDPLALTEDEYDSLSKKMLDSDAVKGTALEILLKEPRELREAGSAREIRETFKALAFGDVALQAAEFGIFMRCAFLAYNIAYRMYHSSDDEEIVEYYKELYELRREVSDLSIPPEFGFERKKPGTLEAMKKFHEFIKSGGIGPEPQQGILNKIQKMMTDWEKAAGKKVPHLKEPGPQPEKVDWIGMEFLDFRYNTAVRLFSGDGVNGEGEDHGHGPETH